MIKGCRFRVVISGLFKLYIGMYDRCVGCRVSKIQLPFLGVHKPDDSRMSGSLFMEPYKSQSNTLI